MMPNASAADVAEEYRDIAIEPIRESRDKDAMDPDDYHYLVFLREYGRSGVRGFLKPSSYLKDCENRPSSLGGAYGAVSSQLRTRSDPHSLATVFNHIGSAPFAYFWFASVFAFLAFVFSLFVYLAFHVLLFNPVLAVFGAIGSVLTALLVQASLAVRKRGSKADQRGSRA